MNIYNEVIPTLTALLTQVSSELPPTVNRIILFGSYARGQQTIYSDIDLAIVHAGNYQPTHRKEEAPFIAEITYHFDQVPLNFFSTNEEKLNLTDYPMNANTNIQKEGIVLWTRTVTNLSQNVI